MFAHFVTDLKKAGVPVSLREWLTLLGAVEADVASRDVEDFYYLARASLVKDERHMDRFDRVFATAFKGVAAVQPEDLAATLPEEWLRKLVERHLSDEEKAKVEALGGFEKLMETLKKRLEEQKARHQGGNKWIGTAGTSPFGAYGYNPEGVRIGQDGNRNFRAVKVWDRREFRDYDDKVEIGTRTMKVALRRLRRFARTGAADELDIDGTIRGTAERGFLDVRLRPERRNAIKVLLLLDIGGSMDAHVRLVEELFSAARSEFKHLAHVYFHNCLYEHVWTENARRHTDRLSTLELLRIWPSDTRIVFVGDASMSPYEIAYPGGSVEHMNEEPGRLWLERVARVYPHLAWINPTPQNYWGYTHSVQMIHEIVEGRMFPLTLEGLDGAMRALMR
jgi:uncharacterized protein